MEIIGLLEDSHDENIGTSFIHEVDDVVYLFNYTVDGRADYSVHEFNAKGNEEPSFDCKIFTLYGNFEPYKIIGGKNQLRLFLGE